nr:hypothetical protein [Tanacetum cinerariifolium]
FKGKTYDQILPIFQARFDANMKFLFNTREEMEKEDEEIIKSINETSAQKAAKRRKLSEEAQEADDLRRNLEIVQDEDDDVFVKAIPLGQKVPVVDYQVQHTPPLSPQAEPQSQPQPQQAADFPISLFQEALAAHASLTKRVEQLENDKVAQALEITKLKKRVKKLEKGNRVKVLKLRMLKKVGTSQRIDTSDDIVMEDESN